MNEITWNDFEKVEIRVGTIVEVSDFPEARKPAYKLKIDLGPEVGVKTSSSQITDLYTKDKLLGRQVICVCNFPPKKVGSFVSEVLTTGFMSEDEKIVIASPERKVPNGSRLY